LIPDGSTEDCLVNVIVDENLYLQVDFKASWQYLFVSKIINHEKSEAAILSNNQGFCALYKCNQVQRQDDDKIMGVIHQAEGWVNNMGSFKHIKGIKPL
jgi:hypothetical protein